MAVKPSQYAPSFILSALRGSRSTQMTYGDVADTNNLSTSSFYYDIPGTPLKSTQQLNVDWSQFENHVFFNSAEVKVNTAFDQIINGYPFDGSAISIEKFFENLTGFDKWVFDNFPVYKGALAFSNNSHIVVNDFAGGNFPSISPEKSIGHSVLNPGTGSMSIEVQAFIPAVTNDNQVICCKFNNGHGYALVLSASNSTSTCRAIFYVCSGSLASSVIAPVTKGKYSHLCAIFDRETASNSLSIYVDEKFATKSTSQQYYGGLEIDETPFLIGSGATMTSITGLTFTPQQTFSGSLDEFRVFHSIRTLASQQAYAQKAITATDDLKLYYKFNEPPPPLSANVNDSINSIVIDSSGNALHSNVTNFTGSLRIETSTDTLNPMIYEKDLLSPVLFPAYPDVVTLNTNLITSASEYDRNNPNIITRLIPEHYLLNGMQHDGLVDVNGTLTTTYTDLASANLHGGKLGSTQLMLSLLYILARFFDEMKLYVDAFGTVKYVEYDETDTTPDNFLPKLLKRFGFDLPPMFTEATVQQYINGDNVKYDISTNLYPLKYVQNQMLRRILTNIRTIMQSKGTQHSIKAFLRAIGIDPDNSMRFREYGGPTTKILEFARERKHDIGTMVKFTTASIAISPYLSGSRTEVGFPEASGNMIDVIHFNPHGISNAPSDGLFTSGSWTYEVTFKYTPEQVRALTSTSQSIGRLCGTSSLNNTNVFANLVILPGTTSGMWTTNLYFSADPNELSTRYLVMSLDELPLMNADKWRVSFGCERNDALSSNVSSSYFLRAGNVDTNGDIEHNVTTSSFFQETFLSHALRALSLSSSAGAFIALGSNQTLIASSAYPYLNNSSISAYARTTTFDGQASNLRFWSKAITDVEWKEHLRNYKSAGVDHPMTNYNFTHTPSGAFERLRVDTLSKQDTLIATPSLVGALTGSIQFIDYSQNNMHLAGTGFDAHDNCVKPEVFYYSYVSPYFDESSNDIKIRARSFKDIEKLKDAPWAAVAPVYEIMKSEQPTDDTRFTIEFSLIDALNRDIITMFSTLDDMNNILGNPELLYSPDYPSLETLSEIYFNRLSTKLNFKAFFEFYRWFDNSIGTFIQQLIPRKTHFKGVNFTIESHMLERNKLRYLSEGIYLGEDNRKDLDKQILLQLFNGSIRKF